MLFLILARLSISARILRAYFATERVSDHSSITIVATKPELEEAQSILVQTKTQYRESFRDLRNLLCYVNNTPRGEFTYNFVLDQLPYTFDMEKGGTYMFAIYNCTNTFEISSISYYFHNSWGYLPFGRYPVKFVTWIEVAFYAILLILWIINTIHHRKIVILIHYVILVNIIIQTAASAINGCVYHFINLNSEARDLTIANNVIGFVRNFSLVLLSLLLAAGLSVVYEVLPWRKWAAIGAVSLLFAAAEFLIDSTFTEGFDILGSVLLIVLYFITYGLHVWAIYHYSLQALQTLQAHLVKCAAAHIDPVTTPSYKKIDILKFTRTAAICILLLFVLSSLCYRLGWFYYFITYIIVALFTAILYGIICWKLRIRNAMAATYGDEQDAYEIQDDQEMVEWEPGVKMPPMPVESAPQNQIHGGYMDDP